MLKEVLSFQKFEMEFHDYKDSRVLENFDLGGVTPKLVVLYEKQNVILKFQKIKGNLCILEHISEFIACKIASELGYDVQNVQLGFYRERECVAIERFDYEIVTFDGFGSSTVGGSMEYDLDLLLTLPFDKRKFICL